MWCQVFASSVECWGGCGQSFSCSILHLSHTCCCTQASKLIHVYRLNQIKQKRAVGNWCRADSFEEMFAGYCFNSLHHTPPHLYCFSGTCLTHASWISCSVWVIWNNNTLKCFLETGDLESVLIKFLFDHYEKINYFWTNYIYNRIIHGIHGLFKKICY